MSHLASKAQSCVMKQIADDWEMHHGYRPVLEDTRAALMNKKKTPFQKAQPFKTANIATANIAKDSQVYLWQKIITVVASIAENFDNEWQKRRRVLSTLLIILFVFRLVFSKNKQGYGSTIAELWEYCHKLNIKLPQKLFYYYCQKFRSIIYGSGKSRQGSHY